MEKYKIVFLGDLGVGKTSIINQFVNNTFDHTHQPTIGIDFLSKTVYLDNRTIRLQLWDTAGQERFRALIPSYIRNCSVAVIVYDVTSIDTFYTLEKWVEDVKKERGSEAHIWLLGNKIDLDRQVQREAVEQKAKEFDVQCAEVCAKTGENVKQVFYDIAQSFPAVDVTTESAPAAQNIKVDGTKEPEKTKSSCCN